MSATAMNLTTPSWNRPASRAAAEQTRAFIAWRQNVEQFSTVMGARCMLEHVEENRWLFWFQQGETAEMAVVRERKPKTTFGTVPAPVLPGPSRNAEPTHGKRALGSCATARRDGMGYTTVGPQM